MGGGEGSPLPRTVACALSMCAVLLKTRSAQQAAHAGHKEAENLVKAGVAGLHRVPCTLGRGGGGGRAVAWHGVACRGKQVSATSVAHVVDVMSDR